MPPMIKALQLSRSVDREMILISTPRIVYYVLCGSVRMVRA